MQASWVLLALVASLGGCGDDDGGTAPVAEREHGTQAPPHFSYEGSTGPEHWGTLNEAWSTCGSGEAQSPIDLTEPQDAELPDLELDYGETKLTIVNNGHAVQVNCDSGSTLKLGDASYELLQFHFHSPSEHTLEGQHFPIEMHLVHKDAAGTLAVVAVMIEEGPGENETFDTIWKHLPRSKAPVAVVPGVRIEIADLVPSDRPYYAYTGSLTTPPCTEGVLWKIIATPMQMSQAQIDVFRGVYAGNNRPIQPLNGRVIERN